MRVVAGSAGGRVLRGPSWEGLRPTTDKVRGAIVNSLGSHIDLQGLRCADLFAGSGAMGIELLSRGVSHVTFVDNDRRAIGLIRENLRVLGDLGDAARVVCGDAQEVAASLIGIDVAVIDPPYDFHHWEELLGVLRAEVAVCESSEAVPAQEGWRVIRSKRYGDTVVVMMQRIDNRSGSAGQ